MGADPFSVCRTESSIRRRFAQLAVSGADADLVNAFLAALQRCDGETVYDENDEPLTFRFDRDQELADLGGISERAATVGM